MRKLMGVVLAAVLLASAISAAAATDGLNRKQPPRLRLLHKGEIVQRSHPWSYCWSYSTSDGGGTGMCADGFPRYPRAARVNAPARLVLRIPYQAEPQRVDLTAHRLIVRHEGWDESVGRGEDIAYRLKPHRERGHITAWDVIFRVTEPLRHYYLDVDARLRQGDAAYALHLRT